MLFLFLSILSLLSISVSVPRRRELLHPIRANCFNIDFCREVSSDKLCDLECSSAECGFDGGDCDSVNEMEAKMMLALHISPSDFMFVSHRFLSEFSSITGSRVEMARDSQDLLMWEWSPSTGPNRRLFPERTNSPPGITSIQVMLSLKILDCSRECTQMVDKSVKKWYHSIRNEELSHFMEEMLYGKSPDRESSHPILIIIAISGCILLLIGIIYYYIFRGNRRSMKDSRTYDLPRMDELSSVASNRKRVIVKEVNRLDKGQDSPLHSLISSSNQCIEEDVEALIKCGESINTVDREGRSVLHISILHGRSPSFFQWLISKGADPSIIDDKGQTLIHLAVASINIKILTLLLDFPTLYRMIDHCDYRNMSALKLSMSEESVDISTLLINSGASVNLAGMEGGDVVLCHRSPLHLAIMNNHKEQVELLLGRGANINAVDERGLTPLHYAALYCEMIMVEILVKDNKCDVVGHYK
ncbi:hypothetical protein PRIPAC_88740 [Pristionchus pacificus]|nr:hypothetical protein PRIPAC_88740 [Pristionchus pacificus]